MLSLLVAMDKNHVIGFEGGMPWHLPNDLKFFKETTTGKTIIMGRKTFESIGRVLPNRRNVVLSRRATTFFPDGVETMSDISEIQKWNEESPDEEFIIIGGGVIFKQMIDDADRMYITLIDDVFQGDTFFPPFELEEWELVKNIKGDKNEKNPHDYYFQTYERK